MFVESSFYFQFRTVWMLNTFPSVIFSFCFYFLLLESEIDTKTNFHHSIQFSWAFLFLTKLVKCPFKNNCISFFFCHLNPTWKYSCLGFVVVAVISFRRRTQQSRLHLMLVLASFNSSLVEELFPSRLSSCTFVI